jgi:hypothetical protein
MKKQIITISIVLGLIGGAGIFFFLRADISDDLEKLRRTGECPESDYGTCAPGPALSATST